MSDSASPSPHSFVPPRLAGPRDSGDGWVEDGTGRKFWGRFGAAGLLAHDPERGILLQHRANWSHFGGTWGLPGGAKHAGESSVDGAIREANEEAGVPTSSLQLKFTSILDLGFWSYTTVVADVTGPFDALVADAESIEVRWVAVDEVATLPLHPGFEASWPELRAELQRPVVLIVDSANVVGSRPNGWWKDRLGATKTFAARLAARSALGFTGDSLGIGLPGTRWWPEVTLIVEGQARGAAGGAAGVSGAGAAASDAGGSASSAGDSARDSIGAAGPAARSGAGTDAHQVGAEVRVVAAEHDGDQAIVDAVRLRFETTGIPPRVFVVTADRELSERVSALGAAVHGPGWLWALLDELGELGELDAAE
ncbi:NUDIX domain-containing protein [Subtercola lobariae]|uniref:NTP pyrophosphohydrolase n=1 Tax=Subtercola lobariae TaxID=1588641 RepID=A0A917EUG7_9MICO|nr:NUDIX hydrolase [Subtercola lobariae]GGF17898.1 NTP pyrophosphohydrolase [Subtercola lobariae]